MRAARGSSAAARPVGGGRPSCPRPPRAAAAAFGSPFAAAAAAAPGPRLPRDLPSPSPSFALGAPCRRRRPPLQSCRLRRLRRRPLPAPPGVGFFEGFFSIGSLLKPEAAALISALVALSSVALNYYGSLATEQRRAALQGQLEDERSARAQQAELQSIIGRYRGPLLESSVDLEQRLWHMATMTGEWAADPSSVCFEEVTYTMFTLSQFLGFLEIVRREGPRERSFLQLGSPHGGDTLATLLEGVKYALCASPVTLEAWLAEPPGGRDHPGARTRTRRGAMRTRSPDAEDEAEVMAMAAAHAAGNGYGSGSGNGSGNGNGSGSGNGNGSGNGATRSEPATTNGNGNGGGNGNGNSNVTAAAVLLPAATAPVRAASPASAAAAAAAAAGPSLRISRGLQRAIGSVMVATPMGAERHYTLSYSEFVARLRSDPQFAAWFRPLERDLAALLTGPSWRGRAPGVHAWTRVLLLQQLLVDAVDLLDPDFVRVPPSRRLRLSPVPYAPLPNVDVFRLQLSALSTGIDPIISAALRQAGGAGPPAGEAGGPPEGTRSLFLEWARARGMMGGGTAAAAAATAAAGGALPGAAAASNGAAAPAHVHFAALANLQAEWDGTVSGSGSSVDGGDGGVGGTGAPGGGGGGGAFTFCGEPVLPAALLPDVGVSGVSLLDLKERPRQAQQEQQQQQQAGWAPAGPIASLFLPLGGLLEQVRGGM